jgi:hypothetical protein
MFNRLAIQRKVIVFSSGSDGATWSVSQFVAYSPGLEFSKHPLAFTEQGVAMLSSVLRSRRAVQINIAIIPQNPPRFF